MDINFIINLSLCFSHIPYEKLRKERKTETENAKAFQFQQKVVKVNFTSFLRAFCIICSKMLTSNTVFPAKLHRETVQTLKINHFTLSSGNAMEF